MLEYRKFTNDFIKGNIDFDEFVFKVKNNDEYYNWFQSLVSSDYYCIKTQIKENGKKQYETIPYDIRFVLDAYFSTNTSENKLNLLLDVQEIFERDKK